jgi:prophage regulatory protein
MPDRFLRRAEVLRIKGGSDATLKRHEAAGLFPARYEIGPNSVGWRESEVMAWVESRKHATKPAPANQRDPNVETAP